MYRGVLYTEMGRKVDAEADIATLQNLNPQLAKDLAEVIKTGKEEDRFYGLSSKIRRLPKSRGSSRLALWLLRLWLRPEFWIPTAE